MTQAIDKKKQVFAELDGLLEHEIRARLATGIWGDEKRRLVQLYLDEKAFERAKAEQADQVAIARSAKNAAWAAAIFAAVAALAALIALLK
jgi:hypothetical protein